MTSRLLNKTNTMGVMHRQAYENMSEHENNQPMSAKGYPFTFLTWNF